MYYSNFRKSFLYRACQKKVWYICSLHCDFFDEFFDFLGKPQLFIHRVSKKHGNIFFDIEVYLKNRAFGSISSASISLVIVLSLGSVLILLFFIRFCLDIPVLLDISFHDIFFSKAISSILFQNSSENCFINRSFGKIRLFPIYVQEFTTISNDST